MHSIRHSDLDRLDNPPTHDKKKRLPRVLTVPLIIGLMALTWVPFIWLILFLVS